MKYSNENLLYRAAITHYTMLPPLLINSSLSDKGIEDRVKFFCFQCSIDK